jgi:threonyl-tRNA synthetase
MKKAASNQNLDELRHSCAHLLAAAVIDLYPKALLTIGPSIEEGFYYDIDFGKEKITDSDLPKVEARMYQISGTWDGFAKEEVTKDKALKVYAKNPYKQELIKEFAKEGQKLTLYTSGKFTDLCRGGHVENPSKVLKHFKLLSVAGAYWRGDEKNPMLTRIYGTAFFTQDELDSHLNAKEEAKRRDHKKLGLQLDLYMFHETAPGMPYWLPKGLVLLNELVDFWRYEHRLRGYQEIKSPLINKKELYITSGHWEHYRDDMFLAETSEKEVYGLKPMNCPNAMVVFGSKGRSYRELPMRLSDTDTLHRFERSGTLNGLLRAREFCQDDAHIYVTEDQIGDEFKRLFEITERFYSIFGLEYRYRLGTRPKGFLGEKKVWDKAEKTLTKVLKENKKEFIVLDGDGAFYGPKIDILMKDSLGREWQMGTLQLDFQLPLRFKLKYSDAKGGIKTPVVIHRVIYGSLERFVGLITEHFAGAFPVWISPVQVKILPITDKQFKYSNELAEELRKVGVRVEIDERSEKLGAKIRDTQLEKVPYMVILGEKEVSAKKVAIRLRTGEDLGQMSAKAFVERITKNISSKALSL